MVNFVTVSTYDTDQINGIYALNSSIKQFQNSFDKIKILTPSFVKVEYSMGFTTKFVEIGNKIEDKYFAKFVLPKYCKQLNPKSLIFYIDPDHICQHEFQLPNIGDNEIFVSSEYYEFDASVLNTIHNTLKSSFIGLDISRTKHFNTSIIISKVDTINKMSDIWEQVYHELYNTLSHRNLEEVSFSIASNICNINITPVECSLQNSFCKTSEDCALFHYGGNYKKSIDLKKMLNQYVYENIEDLKTLISEAIKK